MLSKSVCILNIGLGAKIFVSSRKIFDKAISQKPLHFPFVYDMEKLIIGMLYANIYN